MDLSVGQIALATLAIAFGALVQGSLGFGMALVATPVLIQIDPAFVPGPVLLAGLPLVVAVGWLERHAVEARALPWPFAGQLVGIALGLLLLQVAPQRTIAVMLGILVLFAVAISAFGLHVAPNRPTLAGAGVLAGFMGATASLPGPPLALVHQHVPAAQLRGTMAPLLLFGTLMALPGIWWIGRLGGVEVEAALLLLPGMAIGLALSRVAAGRVAPGRIRAGVLVLSGIAAIVLIQRSVGS